MTPNHRYIYAIGGRYHINDDYLKQAIKIVMKEHQKQCKLLQDELKKYCNSLK